MMRANVKSVLICIGMTLIATSCAFKSAPPVQYYTLDITPKVPSSVSKKYKHDVLTVAYPVSLKEPLGKTLVYSYEKGNRGRYLNAKWANSIGLLLEGTIIKIVRDSQLFKTVVSYDSDAENDFRLETTLYDFYHRIENGKSYAYIDLEAILINMHTGKIAKSKRFVYKVKTPTFDASGYVKAIHRALRRFSYDLIVWLDRG